ncbi:MAG TPA: hypothetical protein VG096_25570 [Bryobacteraceae bacterium]|nr:hypothetical protein [Bryobacteraceae bacterium]
MRITRFPSLTEQQFLGCTAAFVDSLLGELNAAALALRRLENSSKGSAFAHEMTLDTHRYGALIVVDRWATLAHAFGPHLSAPVPRGIADNAAGRVQTAENILGRVNDLLDSSPNYGSELVEACVLAFRSLETTFAEERAVAERSGRLGPMLPQEYTEARRIFLEDLAVR